MIQNKNNYEGRRNTVPESESPARLLQKIEILEREIALTRRFAHHDALTGLPNRVLMMDRLEQAIAQAERQHKCVGVLLLDLDDFKRINGNLGHQAGDVLLQQVAARLLSGLRVCDTACRYGGDEFIILLPEIHGGEDMEMVKRKLTERLSVPHHLGTHNVTIRVSMGSALLGRDAKNCADLISVADADMYRAKRGRRTENATGRAPS